jgi:hypothetical protein
MSFSKYSDTIDSRDVIERIEELQDERQTLIDAIDEAYALEDEAEREEAIATARSAANDWDDENGEELKALLSLQEDAEGYSEDWRYGSTLIRDSYFTDYAQELAEDIGAIKSDATWPNNCIDWDQAARELQMDYTSVEFDGVTYWVR